MNDNIFLRNQASLDMQRSVFKRKSQLKTSFNIGDLIPIYCDEILPGDTVSLSMSEIVRMMTPKAPIMDNIYMDIYFFFVPNRLVWEHAKQFFGENDLTAWTQTIAYQIPVASEHISDWNIGCLADYFGLPTNNTYFGSGRTGTAHDINELPLRAYYEIYNYWFRDENSENPILYLKTDNSNTNIKYSDLPKKVNKFHDLFTSCLPAPQKGPSVPLPLGNLAPVKTIDLASVDISLLDPTKPMYWAENAGGVPSISTTSLPRELIKSAGGATSYNDSNFTGTNSNLIIPANLVADLSKATAATINQLRYAFQLQRYYEKSARGGTRYGEYCKSFFGVTNPDARLQIPEYLSGRRIRINVDQVLATAQTNNSADQIVNPLGNTGAYSATGDKYDYFTKSFTEHGLLIGLACVRCEQTYSQGIDKYFYKRDVLDIYNPTFANIGEVPVLTHEMYAADSADGDVFGYQEAWYEYRFKRSLCTGFMNPAAAAGLNYWTLGQVFGQDPTLSGAFLEQDVYPLDRALAVGSSLTHQFVADFSFTPTFSRVMPLRSTPGLIDHH